MRRLLAGLILVFILGPAAAVVLAAAVDVRIGSYYFEDASVGDGKIAAKTGDQLRFLVEDSGQDGKPHTVEVDELGIHSGNLRKGATYVTPVLTTPGTFVLFCKFHVTSRDHATTLVVTGATITPAPTKPPPTAPPPTATATAPSTPGPSAPPSATPGGSVGPAPTETASASASGASPDSSGSPQPGGVADGSPAPGITPDPGASDSQPPLPVGVGGEAGGAWLRSVAVGFSALIPLVAVALLTVRRSTSRQRDEASG